MHLILIISTLLIVYGVRLISGLPHIKYEGKWGLSLFFFAFPPLVLIMTCITIISMGYQGEMWGIKAGKFSYALAFFLIIYSFYILLNTIFNHYKTCQKIAHFPLNNIYGYDYKLIDISFPYAAQIGLVRSQLVISKGLIELLSEEHLKAVIAHELAHKKYRDTLLFFILFYLKKLGFLLPNNEKLWQNLVLLRELRADKEASKTVDFLLIAESLIKVALATGKQDKWEEYALDCAFDNYRLETRIDNLIKEEDTVTKINYRQITWLILVLIPWLFFPFHNPC